MIGRRRLGPDPIAVLADIDRVIAELAAPGRWPVVVRREGAGADDHGANQVAHTFTSPDGAETYLVVVANAFGRAAVGVGEYSWLEVMFDDPAPGARDRACQHLAEIVRAILSGQAVESIDCARNGAPLVARLDITLPGGSEQHVSRIGIGRVASTRTNHLAAVGS